jgi:hypothetical protein
MDKVRKNKTLVKYNFKTQKEIEKSDPRLDFLEMLKKMNRSQREIVAKIDEVFMEASKKTSNIPMCIKNIHYMVKAHLMKYSEK